MGNSSVARQKKQKAARVQKVNDITVLAVGDKIDFDSFQKSAVEREVYKKCGFDYLTANYSRILEGKLPQIKTDKIIIFFFFPFRYWDKHIEHKNYRGLYGNQAFFRKFVKFWDNVENRLKKHYAGKEVLCINDPEGCWSYRDKMTVMKKLDKAGVSQPKLYRNGHGVGPLLNKLINGNSFFIKPQFGSMGKGITYVSRKNWQTNFVFKNNRIVNRKSDYGWTFSDITGNQEFLHQLLKEDVFVQKGIKPLKIKGNIVDLRIYTFFNKVIYIYPRKNKPYNVTTNISQGGHGDHSLLRAMPKELVEKAKRLAVKVSKSLDIKLAGVDIVPDQNLKKVYVVDVNLFSGFPKRKTFNLARRLAKELKQLNQEGQLKFKRY